MTPPVGIESNSVHWVLFFCVGTKHEHFYYDVVPWEEGGSPLPEQELAS